MRAEILTPGTHPGRIFVSFFFYCTSCSSSVNVCSPAYSPFLLPFLHLFLLLFHLPFVPCVVTFSFSSSSSSFLPFTSFHPASSPFPIPLLLFPFLSHLPFFFSSSSSSSFVLVLLHLLNHLLLFLHHLPFFFFFLFSFPLSSCLNSIFLKSCFSLLYSPSYPYSSSTSAASPTLIILLRLLDLLYFFLALFFSLSVFQFCFCDLTFP